MKVIIEHSMDCYIHRADPMDGGYKMTDCTCGAMEAAKAVRVVKNLMEGNADAIDPEIREAYNEAQFKLDQDEENAIRQAGLRYQADKPGSYRKASLGQGHSKIWKACNWVYQVGWKLSR